MRDTVDEERRFFGLLWCSFLRVYGPVVACIGIFATVAAWVALSPTLAGHLLGYGALVLLILTLANAYYCAHRLITPPPPSVDKVREPFAPFNDCVVVLLLQADHRFQVGTSVIVSRNEDEFALLVGTGKVVTGSGRRTQVVIETIYEGHGDFVERLKANDKGALSSLILHPQIPAEYFAYALGQGHKQKTPGTGGRRGEPPPKGPADGVAEEER